MPTRPEPVFDLAHLAHVELLTPDLAASAGFFTGLLGMQVSERRDGAVYLRGFEEHYHHSLKMIASDRAGLGHAGWRARSPQALDRRVAALEAAGLGRGWIDGDAGHGPAFRFVTPEGHPMEVFFEVDRATPPDGQVTPLRNRPQRRPTSGGVPVRRIDHLNLMVADVATCRDALTGLLGFQERERMEADGTVMSSFLSVTNLSHDIGLLPEPTAARGRFHHVCFCTTALQHLFDLAEMAREAGIRVEAGPGRHGVGGGAFLYLREPGGNRVEVIGDPGMMIFDPDWQTVVWQASDLDIAAAWIGSPFAEEFFTYGTPSGDAAGARPDPVAGADAA